MSNKTICDACGQDMTNDAATGRLAFDFERGQSVWPRHTALRVTIDTTRLGDGETWPVADVCSKCVVRAVIEGFAVNLGPVTR